MVDLRPCKKKGRRSTMINLYQRVQTVSIRRTPEAQDDARRTTLILCRLYLQLQVLMESMEPIPNQTVPPFSIKDRAVPLISLCDKRSN